MSGRQQSLSQYGAQKARGGVNGARTVRDMAGVSLGGYHTPGMGSSDSEPLVTTDENGQRVVQTSGLVRQGTLGADGRIIGGKLASAYDYARSDTKDLLSRWHASRYGTSERKKAMDGLYDAYRARGEYKGKRADFDRWFSTYHSDLIGNSLAWTGAFTGIPTAGADGQPLRGAPERTGGGTSTSGLYQKAGNPYRSFCLKW